MTRQNNTDLKDIWQTPDELLDIITNAQNINLDPCAGRNTSIGDENWTESGLEKDWHGVVFVNPPFSEKQKWLKKAVIEQRNTDVIYFVTPDSTDVQSWWHKYIADEADYVWFSEGRIGYINPNTGEQENNCTFGTAISVFGDPADEVLENMSEEGHLMETYEP